MHLEYPISPWSKMLTSFHNYQIKADEISLFEQKIESKFFSDLFDFEFSAEFYSHTNFNSLSYRKITADELSQHFLNFVRFMFEDIVPSGAKRQTDWEKGWKQNLDEISNQRLSVESLLPHYFRRGQNIMRFKGDFIMPKNPFFERDFLNCLLQCLAEKYVTSKEVIYEFAAGPCYNVARLAQMSRGKRYHALDWAKSSQNIIEFLGENKVALQLNDNELSGTNFNFFEPNHDFKLERGALVYTIGGLEQLGSDFAASLEYFLSFADLDFIHFEPILEGYSRADLYSEMGFQYAKKRNYLNGFLDKLKSLEKDGRIKNLSSKPVIGSAFHDGWTMVHYQTNG